MGGRFTLRTSAAEIARLFQLRWQRLSRDYEHRTESSETTIHISVSRDWILEKIVTGKISLPSDYDIKRFVFSADGESL